MTPARRRAGDLGESLIEILLSIMIIGIALTAVLGGVGVAAQASSQDQRQIQAQALLRSWAEHLQSRTTDATYVACATTTTYAGATWAYGSPAPADLQALPTGFTAAVTQVRYWDTASRTFVTACSPDRGLQQLTLSMTVPDGAYPGFTSRYQVVVRKPCRPLGPTAVPGC